MLNSRQVRNLVDRGITIEVTKNNGIVERYDKTKDGEMIITFSGGMVCKYCGHKLEEAAFCTCDRQFETVSLTGAYRHINAMVKRVGEVAYDEPGKKLYINETTEDIAC